MSALLQQIAAAKEAGAVTDQTEAQKGFERRITPAGVTTARLVGYVEIGKQPQRAFKGEEKPDASEVRLTWELNGPKYMRDVSKKDDPEKLVPTLFTETITLSMNEKAKFFKLFIKMRGAQNVTHMSELLGQGFIIEVKHKKSADGKKTYANIYTPVDGWMVKPPVETSAATGTTTPVTVPEISGDISLLLQAAPSAEQWASIFIDGTYEKEIKGQKVDLSKNFIQFKCVSASDFTGSKLEEMLKARGGLAALLKGAQIAEAVYNNEKPADTPAEKETPAVDTNTAAPTVMPTEEASQGPNGTANEPAPTEDPSPTPPPVEDDAPAKEVDPLALLGLKA